MLNAFRQSEELNKGDNRSIYPDSTVRAQRLSAIRGIKLIVENRHGNRSVVLNAFRQSEELNLQCGELMSHTYCAQRLSAIRGIIRRP